MFKSCLILRTRAAKAETIGVAIEVAPIGVTS